MPLEWVTCLAAAALPKRPSSNPCFSQWEPAKSLVDDLGFCRGVVLSRAAALLRSVETKPYDRWICLLKLARRLRACQWQACPSVRERKGGSHWEASAAHMGTARRHRLSFSRERDGRAGRTAFGFRLPFLSAVFYSALLKTRPSGSWIEAVKLFGKKF